MSITKDDSFIAANRFGYGMRPQDVDTIKNPRDWLHAQVKAPQTEFPAFSGLPTVQEAMIAAIAENHRKRDQQIASNDPSIRLNYKLSTTYIRELRARFQVAFTTTSPFHERLVTFWSNHFAVSLETLLGVIGAYEREAIRANTMGHFADMLQAVALSPAMLDFLNQDNVGFHTAYGKALLGGCNENLAREFMELHTMGVDGGYTQKDVTSLANMITGWNYVNGAFHFSAELHEPGSFTLLGKTYPPTPDQQQGKNALQDLARHPSTARFIALKLAQHFIADEPPVEAVEHLAEVFRKNDGFLPPVYEALIELPQVWDTHNNIKMKNGFDVIASTMGLLGRTDDDALAHCVAGIEFFDYIPKTGLPTGFPQITDEMMQPEAVMRRIEWGQYTASRFFTALAQTKDLAKNALGPFMGSATQAAIAAQSQPVQIASIILSSPEFQRR